MFGETHRLFQDYLHKVINKGQIPQYGHNTELRDLAGEVLERLVQLDFIIFRVHELEQIISRLSIAQEVAVKKYVSTQQAVEKYSNTVSVSDTGIPLADLIEEERARVELKTLTEALYYLASRIRTAVRNKIFPLPGLTSFECAGVRNVRNKLLEHVEGGDSLVFTVSFGRGGDRGPIIKALRRPGQENIFPDQGLFINADEFRKNLEQLIRIAIANMGT